jgi:hypothetical protein
MTDNVNEPDPLLSGVVAVVVVPEGAAPSRGEKVLTRKIIELFTFGC